MTPDLREAVLLYLPAFPSAHRTVRVFAPSVERI